MTSEQTKASAAELVATLKEQHGGNLAPPRSAINRLWLLTKGAPDVATACVVGHEEDRNIADWRLIAVTASALVIVQATGRDVLRFNFDSYQEDLQRGQPGFVPPTCSGVALRLVDVLKIETREDDGDWNGEPLGQPNREFWKVTFRDGTTCDLPPRNVVDTKTAYWVEQQRLFERVLTAFVAT